MGNLHILKKSIEISNFQGKGTSCGILEKALKNAELRELASTLPTILYHGLAENTTDLDQVVRRLIF